MTEETELGRYGDRARAATASLLRGGLSAEAHVAGLPGHLLCFTTTRGDCVIDLAGSLGLDPLTPVSPAADDLWRASVGVYRAHVLGSELAARSVLRQEATRALITATMVAFGLHATPSPIAPPAASAPAAIRRAQAFMDENLHHSLTVGDISAAARISVRALQYGFVEAFGMSPMSYLRSARLAAAYRTLRHADPLQESVTHVARRWGFGHLGRFAAAYTDAFGEAPRTTLAR
ncbi:helix-turn-helix transcriptional regulator [Microbacterium sp. 1.5R]|uniref:helix-turn-helix transcriptional regulator n=1 Tax=Microbacterium sp. 1.5R TaxID=1916917 RepID=UPI0011A544AC|nr:helix-turn-helix transcriptional regulator [Microbacterium sp. 1.5R]